jgi:hypothetical protein
MKMLEKLTNCIECGTQIKYATKIPKWCVKCKRKQPKVYRTKKTIPKRSKQEQIMQYALNKVLPDALCIDGGYYSILRSPKGYPMQLDRFYPDLSLAFEYDGQQHAAYNAFIHKTQAAFDYLQECDRLKDTLCKKMGIRLIRIPHDKKLSPEVMLQTIIQAGLIDEIRVKTKVVSNL